MTLWSQGCSELMKLLHGYDEVVARLSHAYHKDSITLPQPFHFFMGCNVLTQITGILHTRKMVPITGRASSFFVFLEFSNPK